MQDKPTVKTAGGLHVPPGHRDSDRLRQQIVEKLNQPEAKEIAGKMRQISEETSALSLEFNKAKLRETFPDAKQVGLIPIAQVSMRQSPASTDRQLGELLAHYKAQPDIPPVNYILIDEQSLMALLFHEPGQITRATSIPDAKIVSMPKPPAKNG
jgi:hypothetical protein